MLKREDGVVAELLAWDFGCESQAYALVKCDGGKLEEWKIQCCTVVEKCETSEQGESTATDRQQRQQEICAYYKAEYSCCFSYSRKCESNPCQLTPRILHA